MRNIVEKAKIFACAAHEAIGQRRKYTNEPYIFHPKEVVDILTSCENVTEDMFAAAWLHDVIEDTQISLLYLGQFFNTTIVDYVDYLTEPKHGGNRDSRKKLQCLRLANAPAEVKTIKLADLISNTSTIVQHDPRFAKVYLAEKRELLKFLKDGDDNLYKQAYELAHQEITNI